MKQFFLSNQPFSLEMGGILPELKIAFHTYGTLNDEKSNVIWICHALTASSDARDWWNGLVGENKIFDPQKYFIVCANIIGSPYGSTSSNSVNPANSQKYGIEFPFFTIRDMVKAHQLLKHHLGIEKIKLLIGGSMGGYQALEWTISEQSSIKNLFLIATSAEESAWGKAIHTAQRLAIESDPEWTKGEIGIGDQGLKAARGIGMLTYRNYDLFKKQQSDENSDTYKDHKATSYIKYQAQKLADRFDALSYYKLTEAMDAHQLARGRNKTVEEVLNQITIPTLVMGISSDILCPPQEQQFLARHIPTAEYHEIDSEFGHDGFLIESVKIGEILKAWMKKNIF
ncbi:MAG TPA: homoserine O-acetyltransferase [Faecalibacter sp.]